MVFDGCNFYGDEIYFICDNEYYSLTAVSSEASDKILNLIKGDEIYIYLETAIATDNSFENSVLFLVRDIEIAAK